MQLKVTSDVTKGKLTRDAAKTIASHLAKCSDKVVTVTIQVLSPLRSNSQNRFYWGVVVPMLRDGISECFGEVVSLEKAHELVKTEYLYHEVVNQDTGVILRLSKSTTELTTKEWEVYIDQIRLWASEMLGITIPLPNEQLTILTN